MTNRRRHNSCIDFTFCSNGATNGTKLVKLNALFERIADREYGGIREEKLSKLIPSSPSNGLKYGHLQKKKRKGAPINSLAAEDLRTISRGPFLAMFSHESMTFVSTLAINEKAGRDGKKQASRKKKAAGQNKVRQDQSVSEKESKHQKESNVQNVSVKATSPNRLGRSPSLENLTEALDTPRNQKQDESAHEVPHHLRIPTPNAPSPNQGTSLRSRANTAPTGSAEFMQLLQDSSDDASSSLEISSLEDASSCDDESSSGSVPKSFRNDAFINFSNSEQQLRYQQQKLSPKSRRRYRRSASDRGSPSFNATGPKVVSPNRARSRSISSQEELSINHSGSDQSFHSTNEYFPFSPYHNPYDNAPGNQKQLQQQPFVTINSPIKPGHRRTVTPIAVVNGLITFDNLLHDDSDKMKPNRPHSPSPTKTLTTDGPDTSNNGDSWDLSSYSMSSGEDENSHVYYHSFHSNTPNIEHSRQEDIRTGLKQRHHENTCMECSFLSTSVQILRKAFPFLFQQSSLAVVNEGNGPVGTILPYGRPIQLYNSMEHAASQPIHFPQYLQQPLNGHQPPQYVTHLTPEEAAYYESQMQFEYFRQRQITGGFMSNNNA